ncbi:uncharacterized protein LOC127082300 [Lathyrus oleraceus]|uniref:uncharacterized protein LOC127082300 n=1 Tax=Pisum sativum TaxID=3888 RepID=UPI0021D3B4DB|nr:uncharacterized protein LOC127082300 [Pisum sativum]
MVPEQNTDGRNDDAIISALQAVARAMQNNQQGGIIEFNSLRKFHRNNLPTFKGRYDPKGTRAWLRDHENIFRVMACTKAQKVQFGTHMLNEEADDWWEDIRGKKEIEFLELKQGNSTVAEYAAKFEELVTFCPYNIDAAIEVSKCIKLENGLLPEIKQAIRYQHILRFPELVKNCRIYDEDGRARSTHYKSLSKKRGSYRIRENMGKRELGR